MKPIAVIFALLFAILVTGSFHEDGLEDTMDGFGGGWTKDQKLEIMKDSRIGTYGAISIWFALTLKFLLLNECNNTFNAILIAHPLSRSIATGYLYFLPYVRLDDSSNVKPLAKKQNGVDFSIAKITGCTAFALVLTHSFWIFSILILFSILWGLWLNEQIGGFTGDVLGATQRLSEIIIYTILLMGQIEYPTPYRL